MTKAPPIDVEKLRSLIAETDGSLAALARRLAVSENYLRGFIDKQPALSAELEAAREAAKQRDIFDPPEEEVREHIFALDGQPGRLATYYGRSLAVVRKWLSEHPETDKLAADLRAAIAENVSLMSFEPDPPLVIAAIQALNGNLGAIARQFHTSRSALNAYINRHPEVQSVLYDTSETMVDMAESALYRAVLAGERWAVIFFLKTRGRKRGYIERGESFSMNLNLSNLSIQQLERLAAGEHPAIVLGSATETRARGPEPYPVTIEGTSDPGPQTEAD